MDLRERLVGELDQLRDEVKAELQERLPVPGRMASAARGQKQETPRARSGPGAFRMAGKPAEQPPAQGLRRGPQEA